MEIAAVAAQQAMFRQDVSLAMIKKSAEVQQDLAAMIMETVTASGRGQMVNISV